jgi:hypothetical protein
MAIVELNAVARVGENFCHNAVELYQFFFRHPYPPYDAKRPPLSRTAAMFTLAVWALRNFQPADGDLAGARVCLRFEGHFLSLAQRLNAGAFKRGCMHENVFPTVIRLNKAKTLLAIVELHRTLRHKISFR